MSRCGGSAPYSTEAPETVEKSRVKFIRRAHTTSTCTWNDCTSRCTRVNETGGEALGVTSLSGKIHDPDPTSGRPIVSVGRATDSYEFGWHPVLNKSRTRTLSGHKIYGTSHKTCERAAEFYFGKNPLRQNGVQIYSRNSARHDFLISHIKY